MIWRRRFSWQGLVLGVNCLLLLGLIYVWWGPATPLTSSRPARGPEVPKAPFLRDQQPVSAFRVIVSKNLFSQDRTGPQPNLAVVPESGLEGHKLMGTIIIGNEKAALIGASPGKLRGPQAVNVQVVRLGEQLGAFTVVDISSEAVVFQGKEGKTTLNFPE
jgi:hypothetical protein